MTHNETMLLKPDMKRTWNTIKLFYYLARISKNSNDTAAVLSIADCMYELGLIQELTKAARAIPECTKIIAERKLLARNERIQNLEALLQDADRRLSIQNQKFETQLQAVKERLEQARGTFFSYSKNVGVQI